LVVICSTRASKCGRDEKLAPMYELSCSLATLEPPSPETLALYEALRTNPAERNRFFGTLGGAVSSAEYARRHATLVRDNG